MKTNTIVGPRGHPGQRPASRASDIATCGVERLFKGRDRVVLLEVLAQGIQR